jgi:ABC-type polysaccharide/polyol phosphate transport system ATPase subunit
MSSDRAIKVEKLGKCYQIYDRPRDRLFQMFARGRKQYYREFWALNDVSLDVKKGESVGIIGRNGSGKSTLLQLICGTLNATTGSIQTNGRVAALLELGSGFNFEFTGRENVNMNAMVLGLSQKEIDARFEDIAAFADIGDFMEQPVKTYSSGMMVRLAFAVQAQVSPDILIVDEALAVGDALFQRKCYMTLDKLKAKGTTILFVSHDIGTVKSFTEKTLLLDLGKMVEYGSSPEVCLKYNQMLFGKDTAVLDTKTNDTEKQTSVDVVSIIPKQTTEGYGRGCAEIQKIEIIGLMSQNNIRGGEAITINFYCAWDAKEVERIVKEKMLFENINVGVLFQNVKHISIFGFNSFQKNVVINFRQQNEACVSFNFTIPNLATGDYFITTAIVVGDQKNHEILAWYDDAIHLKCESSKRDIFGIVDVGVEIYVQ